MEFTDMRRWAVTGAVLTSLSLVGAAPLSLAKGGEVENPAVSGKTTGGGGGGGGGKAADPAGPEGEGAKATKKHSVKHRKSIKRPSKKRSTRHPRRHK